jgi:hypothetical protein
MIDHHEIFIQKQVQKFLRKCLKGPGRVSFSKAKCTAKHRHETFRRVCEMLRMMEIKYSVAAGCDHQYTIIILKDQS